MNKMNYGRYRTLQNYGAFYTDPDMPAIAGISGGRTSGFMGCMLADHVQLCFENTGLEYKKTYEFLARLEDGLGRAITWLEYRAPAKLGAPPREAQFAVVTYETAARKGEPFLAMLEALAAYRRIHKGEPPVSPWARQRICTAHLKHKVQDRFILSQGIEQYETFVGLRADEPDRVGSLRKQETRSHAFRVPLYDAGIDKNEILRWWSEQSFDLDIPEGLGNCTCCFLKDQGDLARNLGRSDCHRDVWLYLQDNYPMFGGKNFPGYRSLDEQRKYRLEIETALRAGPLPPPRPPTWSNQKFLAVIRDEKERIEHGPKGFSCACEASYLDGYAEDV